jgi:flagellar motor switch protein FliG
MSVEPSSEPIADKEIARIARGVRDIAEAISNTHAYRYRLREPDPEDFWRCVQGLDSILGGVSQYVGTMAPQHGDPLSLGSSILLRLQSLAEDRPEAFQVWQGKDLPRAIASVLSSVNPDVGALVLNLLPDDFRVKVAICVGSMPEPQEGQTVEPPNGTGDDGGPQRLIAILNRLDRQAVHNIAHSIEHFAPELAERLKNRLAAFEDILLLDDRGIQRLWMQTETKDWVLALKVAEPRIKAAILRNISKRSGEMLMDDIETVGPVRMTDVMVVQAKIARTILWLEERNEITVNRSGEVLVP